MLYIYARPLLLPGSWLLPTYLPTASYPVSKPATSKQDDDTTALQSQHLPFKCRHEDSPKAAQTPRLPPQSPLTPTAHRTEFGQSFISLNFFHDDRNYLTSHLISRPLPHHHHHPQQRPPPPGDSPYSSPSIKKHIINKIDSNSTLKTTSSSSTIKKSLFRTCRDLKKNAWLEQPKPPFLFFPKLARCLPPFPHLFFFRKLEYTPSHHSILTVPHFPKRPLRCASGRAVAGG